MFKGKARLFGSCFYPDRMIHFISEWCLHFYPLFTFVEMRLSTLTCPPYRLEISQGLSAKSVKF